MLTSKHQWRTGNGLQPPFVPRSHRQQIRFRHRFPCACAANWTGRVRSGILCPEPVQELDRQSIHEALPNG
jgi:hypothetical protein